MKCGLLHLIYFEMGCDSLFFSFEASNSFLKGKILRSGEWERGKFDFGHDFAFLTNFLKRQNFFDHF